MPVSKNIYFFKEESSVTSASSSSGLPSETTWGGIQETAEYSISTRAIGDPTDPGGDPDPNYEITPVGDVLFPLLLVVVTYFFLLHHRIKKKTKEKIRKE